MTSPFMPRLNVAGTGYEANPWEFDAPGQAAAAATSGNVAAAVAAATFAAVVDKFGYLQAVDLLVGGATAASIVDVTITGLLGGTRTYPIAVPAGAATLTRLQWRFNPPLRSAAVNTAITVSMPSLGTGNTRAQTDVWGYAA